MLENEAHKIFLREANFVAGAARLEQIPTFGLPEITFVGRSNAGKSSLVNALLNRNSLARTSQTPGHTRQLNFFNLSESMMLVDVPGYGYAKAPKKDVKQWQGTLFSYLRGRRELARAFVLVDARHGIKPADEEMFELLNDAAVSFQIVLTKSDLISEAAREKMREATEKRIAREPAAHPYVIITSSEKKLGIDALRQAVLDAAFA